MNPGVHNWSSREIVFADAMARATEFGVLANNQLVFDPPPPTIPYGEFPPRLGEGWPDPAALGPGKRVVARLFNNMDGTIPDGRQIPWILTWEGTGRCSLLGPAVVGEGERASNRVEVFVDPEGDPNSVLMWTLDSSDPADPVRDAHVWLPGMEASRPLFWPPYVLRVKAMNRGQGPHTWRTLNWSQVNRYGAVGYPGAFLFDYWDRTRPSSPSQGTRKGVCVEYQVAFCNEVGANLHLNIPHRTSQMNRQVYLAYVYDLLLRVRDGSPAVPGIHGGQRFQGLRSDLSLTIELSNEIWNPGFPVYFWMRNEAERKGISVPAQIAGEIEDLFDLAREVFSKPESPRLLTYVGGTLSDPGFVGGILANLRPDVRVDSAGTAAYFGPRPAVTRTWIEGFDQQTGTCPNCPTVLEVLRAGRDSIDEMLQRLRSNKAQVDAWTNLDGSHPAFVVYEAGQSFVAGYQPWAAAANAAQLHPRMYDIYVESLVPTLVQEGVSLVNWFCFMGDQEEQGGGGNGPFGIWDNMKQTITLPVPAVYVDEGAPKAAAIYRGPPHD